MRLRTFVTDTREAIMKISFINSQNLRAGKLPSRRKGSIVVLMAGAMTVLVGCVALAVDYSMLVNDANNTQRAVDAAALAAASELRSTLIPATNQSNAQDIAVKIATQNRVVGLNRNKVTFFNGVYDTATKRTILTAVSASENANTVRVEHTTGRNFLFGPVIKISKGSVTRAATAILKVTDSTTNGAPMGITEETANYYKEPTRLAEGKLIELTLRRTNKDFFAQETVAGVPTMDPFALFDLRGDQSTDTEGGKNGKSPSQMSEQFSGETTAVATKNGYETALNAEDKSAQLTHVGRAIQEMFRRSSGAPWYDNSGGWNDGLSGNKYSDILNSATSAVQRSNPRVVNVIVTPERAAPRGGTFNAFVKDLTPIYIEKATITETGRGNAAETIIKFYVRFLTPTTGGGGGQAVNETAVGESSGNYSISLLN